MYSVCRECPLRTYTESQGMRPLYPSKQTVATDIFVLGGYPDFSSMKYGTPFSINGRYGVVRKTVERERRKRTRSEGCVVYGFACRCQPEFDKEQRKFKTSVSYINSCSVITKDWLDFNKPKVILALGTDAYRVFGIFGKELDHRGSVRMYKDIPVVCTYSALSLSKNAGLLPMFANDVNKALDLAHGSVSYKEPEIWTPTTVPGIVAKLDMLLERADAAERGLAVAFDTETTSLKPWEPGNRVISMSFSWSEDSCLAFPFEHRDCRFTDEEFAVVLDKVKQVFLHPKVRIICHNAKFDEQWLWLYGIPDPKVTWDTMIAEHCISEDKAKGAGYSLKTITKDRFYWLGGYEDELRAVQDRIRNEKEDEKKRLKDEARDATRQRMLDKWLSFDIDERRVRLAKWVDEGRISVSDTESFVKIKRVKRNGVETITKKYLNDVVKLLGNVEEFVEPVVPIIPPILEEFSFEDTPLDVLLRYGALDAYCTRLIARQQELDFAKDRKVLENIRKSGENIATVPARDAFLKISMPLVYNLATMENHGVRVDRELAKSYMRLLADKADELKENIFMEVGFGFNINSTQELADVLFRKCGFECEQYTKSGAESVSENALKDLSAKNREVRFLDDIIKYRKVTKVSGTYLSNWLERSDKTGYIHASFNQTGTNSYRLSSNNPNLQNVPFNLNLGADFNINLKKLFLPDEGFVFFDCDIKNAEVRTLCAYSQDEKLISTFNEGVDLHSLTAAGISGGRFTYEQIKAKKEDKNSEEYKLRHVAKMVSFGTIYGITAQGLSGNLWADAGINVSPDEAQQYLDKFFVTYPGVQKYVGDTERMLAKYQFVCTFFGRRRRFTIFNWDLDNPYCQRCARQAVNNRIQSTSSDLVMMCLNRLNDYLFGLGDGSRVLLTVHDSIPFQVREDRLDGLKEQLDRLIMDETAKAAPWLPVRWEYDAAYGASYGETDSELQ